MRGGNDPDTRLDAKKARIAEIRRQMRSSASRSEMERLAEELNNASITNEDCEGITDSVTMDTIEKKNAIVVNNTCYDVRSLQKWVIAQGDTIPLVDPFRNPISAIDHRRIMRHLGGFKFDVPIEGVTAISTDGKRLGIITRESEAVMIDTVTQQHICISPKGMSALYIALHPTQPEMAVTFLNPNGVMRIWVDGKAMQYIKGSRNQISKYSDNGKQLIYLGMDGDEESKSEIHLWEIGPCTSSMQEVFKIENIAWQIADYTTFQQAGRFKYVAGASREWTTNKNEQFTIWDATNGNQLQTYSIRENIQTIYNIHFLPGGKRILVGKYSDNGPACAWDWRSNSLSVLLNGQHIENNIILSASVRGKRLMLIGSRATQVLDYINGQWNQIFAIGIRGEHADKCHIFKNDKIAFALSRNNTHTIYIYRFDEAGPERIGLIRDRSMPERGAFAADEQNIYSVPNNSKEIEVTPVLQNGGHRLKKATRHKFQGRSYVVCQGPRGGNYITVGDTRHYLPGTKK